MPNPPRQYSTLSPFEDWFRSGTPILTYHKLGARPAGARLKGLYLSSRRFKKQLSELKQAGFSTPPLASVLPGNAVAQRHVILSFDDGFRNVFENGLEPLREHQFRAIQFLVADLLGRRNEWDLEVGEIPAPLMDASQVREWLSAGHEIGSHSLTHPRLTQLSASRAREEIAASKKKLEDLFHQPIEHFCYPYGDWNDAVAGMVEAAGYRSACTTNFGLVTSASRAFALDRISVRYPSRSLKTAKAWLAAKWKRAR